MKRNYNVILSCVIALCAAPALGAAVTTYDANVSEFSSSTAAVPGVVIPIGGSGIGNGNFIRVQDSVTGVEIGIRAKERFVGNIPNTLGTYYAQAGESTPGLPTWNYELHIDMRGSGQSLGDYTASVTTDLPNHSSADLQAALEAAFSAPAGSLSTVELFQTSQNAGFFASGIDPFAYGTYNFALALTPKSGTPGSALIANMIVEIVPEPATGFLALIGLAGVAMRRR